MLFNDSSYSGAEADGVIAVTVVATGESSLPYTVTITPIELDPVSASELVDYISVSRNVTIVAGNVSQTFDVPLIDDNILEPTEQFEAVIKAIHLIEGQEPTQPVLVGEITVATGTILDNDGMLLTCILILNKL